MRGRKTIINTTFSLLEEAVSIVCGFILPRLILTAFGSEYNGLTTSITQFLACAVLFRSGVGGAMRAALYKSIAKHDQQGINAIVNATDRYMKKIGCILAAAIVVFAAVYPLFVENNFTWLFTFSLFLIIGASTFAESFFGITYLIVLQADQRVYISTILRIGCYVLNTAIGVVLILNNFSIHMVKLWSATVYVAYPIVMGLYVKRHYKIDKNVPPNYAAIEQRWDAFWHQVAVFVMNNTDVMVLTVLTNLMEVSVYSVYNMVLHGLKRIIVAFSQGLEAAFGNMIAKHEDKLLRENLSIVETVIYGVATVAYTCAAILIFDFVRIYTNGISDTNYIRFAFGYVIITANFFGSARLPYEIIVHAAGHYKQTKKGAIIESILNITLSVIFVFQFDLVGVAVGTLAATIFRTCQYSYYMRKHIVLRNSFITSAKIIVSFMEGIGTMVIIHMLNLPVPSTYFDWFLMAFVTGAICFTVVCAGTFVCFNTDFRLALRKVLGNVRAFRSKRVRD